MNRILVIQTAFIGDVVLATALLEKWHRHYPDARISMLVRKGNEALLAGHPFLDHLFVWDKKKGKYTDLLRILQEVRKANFELVINVQRFAATGLLTVLSGAALTIGFDKNPFSLFFSKRIRHQIGDRAHPIHEVARNQQLIADYTDELPAVPRLYPTEADKSTVESLQANPYVCIAPASVWFTKQYPEDQWVKVIDRLPATLQVYLIGGPGDAPLAERIRTAVQQPDRVQNLCGTLSLLESAALQQDAVRNLVNDSAPMHFASAMNAPVTAIYCSTIPEFGYGPLSLDKAIMETAENLSCRPCGLHGKKSCPLGHFHCAYTISVEKIASTVKFP
jgi:heptosyltransferase-2